MKIAGFTLLIAFLVVSLLSCGDAGSSLEVAVGNKAPAFSLTSLNGKRVTSRSLEDNVVILNFWATWRQNCKKEIPMLKQLAAGTKAKEMSIARDRTQKKSSAVGLQA